MERRTLLRLQEVRSCLTLLQNGITTMPHYYPYNQYKGEYDGILDHLEADIICIQGQLHTPARSLYNTH